VARAAINVALAAGIAAELGMTRGTVAIYGDELCSVGLSRRHFHPAEELTLETIRDPLRKRMLEDMQIRNFRFSRHFKPISRRS